MAFTGRHIADFCLIHLLFVSDDLVIPPVRNSNLFSKSVFLISIKQFSALMRFFIVSELVNARRLVDGRVEHRRIRFRLTYFDANKWLSFVWDGLHGSGRRLVLELMGSRRL